jgi:hypothetical protein
MGLWLSVTTLILSAGCTPSGLGAAGDAKASTAPSAAPSPTEAAELYSAEQALIRDCMAANGFGYWPLPPPVLGVDELFPFVIDDVSWARAHGYSAISPTGARETGDTHRNADYVMSLPVQRRAQYFVALDGQASDPQVW